MLVTNEDRRGPASGMRRPVATRKVRKLGSAGLVAAAAAAHCAGVSVWTPGVTGSKSWLAQNCARAAAGRNGLLTGTNRVALKMPDGAMIVLTVFFENMPRM